MDDDDKVALVDMDGTLCDFRGALDRDLARILNGRGEEVKIPACVKQEIEWLIRRTPGWYLNLEPLPLGFDILRMLQDIGFSINILTKSSFESENAWSEKPKWISKHLPKDIEMTVTMNKSRYYGRVLVDDYPSHFLRWMDKRPRGIVVMPVQAWNKDTPRRPNLHPVASTEDLEELRPILEDAFNRKGGERGNPR